MARFTSQLSRVKIAAPCSANWDEMYPIAGDKVRFCSQCNLNVYNLSGLTRREAEVLLTKAEGRLCVRFYQRMDGTILTQNCPVGLRALKRRAAWAAQLLLGMMLSFLAGLGVYHFTPLKELIHALQPYTEPVVMGGIAVPMQERSESDPAPAPGAKSKSAVFRKAESGSRS